jgi:translation initiation factor IF-2
MNNNKQENNTPVKSVVRPPVVVVMGHVDHGKSTLLDYIRKTNVVSGEIGGITQCISAYEVSHKDESGKKRLITFLDTPGHEAFSRIRTRGAQAADIAILVVSAEDSVKTQTLEAFHSIKDSGIPYIVAINKIDKQNVNIDKVKNDLLEEGIYLEGMGGDIPFVLISAKTGQGIPELLDLIVLLADLENFTGDPNLNAEGIVIEANCEPKRGISAVCLIKNGTLKSGMFVIANDAIATTRIMENFLNQSVHEISFSSPVILYGFNKLPEVGSTFTSFNSKKDAEKHIIQMNYPCSSHKLDSSQIAENCKIVPIIVKSDLVGSGEAIEKEIEKLNDQDLFFKVIDKGVGAINESDLKMASINKDSIIVGFKTKIDNGAKDLNESLKVHVELFDIIYKLTDWLKELKEERRPRQETIEITGTLKVLKTFGQTKNKQIVGGKVVSGRISNGANIKIIRRSTEIGTGKIVELQTNKIKAKEILEGSDCGIQVESKIDIAEGDALEAFIMVIN